MLKNIDYIFYSLCCFVWTPLIILVNKRLYTEIRNEEHKEQGKVIQHIIQMFSLILCISPSIIYCECILVVLTEYQILDSSLKRYLISGCRFLTILLMDYAQAHSLVIAVCRYTFTVFEQQAQKLGIQKLRVFFIVISIVIPFSSTLFFQMTHDYGELYRRLFYNISSGLTNYSINYLYSDQGANMYTSVLFAITKECLPSSLIYGIYVVATILFVILYSNIIEGFIYLHIFLDHKR